MDVFVRGIGFFTPGFASASAWCDGKEDPALEKPEAAVLEGALRRRATPLTRLSIEALSQAVLMAGADLATIATVWGTAHGEHTPAIKMLKMMKTGEGRVSPTQFHNSVHNTAGGYASITSNNTSGSTTLTGGSELLGAALLEAICRIDETREEVAVVLGDERLQSPFELGAPTADLAYALVLSPREDGARARLSDLSLEAEGPLAEEHARFGPLYISAGLPLLSGIVRGEASRVPLELGRPGGGPRWNVTISPGA